jgi:phosphoribosylaminoimidazole-succinocarboxamide synthase
MKFSADCEFKKTANAVIKELLSYQMGKALFGVENPAPNYRGKVRDVFTKNHEVIIVTTDRISAFDVVLGAIPFKGALLTEQAVFWLNKSREIIDNHLIERLDDQVMRCQKAEPFRVEMIVRGYLAGSLLREPAAIRGSQYGLQLDSSLCSYAQLPEPILTPTTKAVAGKHDSPISLKEIVSSGLMTKLHLDQVEATAIALFKQGSAFSKKQGLLLVDTKYEFGLCNEQVILIDEIHTADSSRYWIASSYNDCLATQKPPQMLDKERLRNVLLQKGYDGNNMASMPKLNDEMSLDLATHYWQLTETLLGKAFTPNLEAASTRISRCLSVALPQR